MTLIFFVICASRKDKENTEKGKDDKKVPSFFEEETAASFYFAIHSVGLYPVICPALPAAFMPIIFSIMARCSGGMVLNPSRICLTLVGAIIAAHAFYNKSDILFYYS